MTKEEILEHFKDINYAYNESTRYDDLKRMLEELALSAEPCVGSDECKEVIKAYFDGQADTLEWIPIKTRPMTEEEKEHYRELGWDDTFLDEIVMYDCDLPKDGQEVLITTKYGEVQTDTFCDDGDGASFEIYSDDGYVLAWMPKPEPYKAESDEDNG